MTSGQWRASVSGTPTPDYTRFTVLLDGPPATPELGFQQYADAFAQIIELSAPRFAIGIFGDWGSGKTTLMREIEERVKRKPDAMLPVWFNAWRYEREDHLIVPLLDHLRDALLEWGEKRPGGEQARATEAAGAFGRAARAVLRGLSLTGGVPGFEATLDFGKAMETPQPDDGPASFYHAAFADMKAATKTFAPEGADQRIVVFIDDLDRCLPANALQVLESMKLFFDLSGFVFVVGLDQNVIERSIEAKYESAAPAAAPQVVIERGGAEPDGSNGALRPVRTAHRAARVTGADYIKKIFQVPFALPRIGTGQIDELLGTLPTTDMPDEQSNELWNVVRPHLTSLSDRDSLNPREVKRLINAYTLQMKLLAPRLGSPNPHTVLALQVLGFRADWLRIYDVLRDDPDAFLQQMNVGLEHPGEPILLGDEEEPVPQSLIAYLRGHGAPLLTTGSLAAYVSSAEQTRSTDVGVGTADAREAVRRLRRLLRTVASDQRIADQSELLTEVSRLQETLVGSLSSSPVADDMRSQTSALEQEMKSLSAQQQPADVLAGANRGLDRLAGIADLLREASRQATLAVG